MPEQSTLERTFIHYLTILAPDLPMVQNEYQFAPDRKWRFDFAYPFAKVAIEIEGVTHKSGRHQRPAGYAADCEKYNAAVVNGWRVLRFTGDMLNNDPFTCIAQIKALLQPVMEDDGK